VRVRFLIAGFFSLLLCMLEVGCGSKVQTLSTAPEVQFNPQPFQPPENCLPCHQRQYNELHSAVKSGYRNVSPLFNGLESAGNLVSGGLLRPVYHDSTIVLPDGTPLNTNMYSSPVLTETRQVQAGFCFTCHNADIEVLGEDITQREVPALAGLGTCNPAPPAGQMCFQPQLFRPLRDYVLVDANGNQLLPPTPGADPPAGALPSLGAAGITCDVCHDENGPDLNRSFQMDGFGNTSLLFSQTDRKVGPFLFPVAVKNGFHVASNDSNKIAFLTAGAFCNTCHDVRVPNRNLVAEEHNINPGGQNVSYFRLENLSTEWQIGPYNSTNNPFGQVVRCQDCHMSLFPYSGTTTYQVGDLTITSPTPGTFATDYAAVPGVATDMNAPLPLRKVVEHYFTGVDVPLMSPAELSARLGAGYPDPYMTGTDTHGVPDGLATRRQDLMKAATRISLQNSDTTAQIGQSFMVRLEAVALSGHRFPSGFSQERTAYVALTVTDNNGFLLYQSGYVIDKPHPITGENAPDGNLNDEDLEHVHVVVDPGSFKATYTSGTGTNGGNNLVFEAGPDDGPDARVFEGAPEGLVLFRNELTHIFLPGQPIGRIDPNTGLPVTAQGVHFEETFNAALANAVDNFRSLQPLQPRTYDYEIQLPTQQQLQALGVTLQGPLHVHAQVNFEHFPPLFLRFLAGVTSPAGPTGNDLNLVDEARIDTYLFNIQGIASSDITVSLTP
jgi:cytochrome c553